jgi:hypothetical protein
MLYQLSYAPWRAPGKARSSTSSAQPLENSRQSESELMGVRRVELRTSRLSGGRSDHLSYTPRLEGT